MWIRVDGQGMTEEVISDLHSVEELDVSAIQFGQCATWLNLDTGALILHLNIGRYGQRDFTHALLYRAPNRELMNIGHHIRGSLGSLFEGNVVCTHRSSDQFNCWRYLVHSVELMLELRDDEFILE